jgi:hypothetical protein
MRVQGVQEVQEVQKVQKVQGVQMVQGVLVEGLGSSGGLPNFLLN